MGNFIKSFTKELDQSACQSACFHIVHQFLISCVLQDLFSQKPCCISSNMSSSVKCLARLEATLCSNILRRTQVSEIGL